MYACSSSHKQLSIVQTCNEFSSSDTLLVGGERLLFFCYFHSALLLLPDGSRQNISPCYSHGITDDFKGTTIMLFLQQKNTETSLKKWGSNKIDQ